MDGGGLTMQICKVKNYQELSRKAANLIAAQITLKPDSVLGLATGSSPIGTYDRLVEIDRKSTRLNSSHVL